MPGEGEIHQVYCVAKIGHISLKQALADFRRHERHTGLRIQIVAGVIGEHNRDPGAAAVIERQASTQKRVVDMYHIHGLEQFPMLGFIAQGQVIAGICQGNPRVANDARLVILIVQVAEGEHIYFVALRLQDTFVKSI